MSSMRYARLLSIRACVLFGVSRLSDSLTIITLSRLSAIPGGADRSLTVAHRVKTAITFTALLGSTTAMVMYFAGIRMVGPWRPFGTLFQWFPSRLAWITGRREL